ncbi:hypothetical protein [Rhodococcus artemisiae]|uniref:Lipoprotein n=1 Tax=Rhodococcus artemisiae TaxID=714159 RepID=A0ABU7L468_9NOCA|nr:hypothetical protein [Rhodococcus artemisiae]MEE2056069.1 hypothetical protein [Rhodococcus artemisiae]
MTRICRPLTVISMLLFLGGCTQPSSSIHSPATPELQIAYTNSWSAEPSIDLFSRGSELVRASLEAGWQTSNYTFEDSFPGYREAIGYPGKVNRDITWIVQSENTEKNRVGEFTARYHITELIESPTEITANVCEDFVYAETKTYDTPARHGFSWTVALRNTSDTPGLPGIVDTDPDEHDPRARRTPGWDVFGTWKITRLTPDSLDNEQNLADPACTTWWLTNHPDTLRVVDHFTFRPPGTVPGVPRTPQYPEWIGQSEPQ